MALQRFIKCQDAFGHSLIKDFRETSCLARKRSTKFLWFNTNALDLRTPFGAVHATISGDQNTSDTKTSWQLATLPASLSKLKDALAWSVRGQAPAEGDSIFQKFVYEGGGAVIHINAFTDLTGWQAIFGNLFPAVVPLAPGPKYPQLVMMQAKDGDLAHPIENGLYGRVSFPVDGGLGTGRGLVFGVCGICWGGRGGISPFPLPAIFTEDEGSLRAEAVNWRHLGTYGPDAVIGTGNPDEPPLDSMKQTSSLFRSFTYGSGRVVVFAEPMENDLNIIEDPITFADLNHNAMRTLARNAAAWVCKQFP